MQKGEDKTAQETGVAHGKEVKKKETEEGKSTQEGVNVLGN